MTNLGLWGERAAVSGLVVVSGLTETVAVEQSVRAVYGTGDIYIRRSDGWLLIAWGDLARVLKAVRFRMGAIPLALGPDCGWISPVLSVNPADDHVTIDESSKSMPPFAAVELSSGTAYAYVDSLGFRQLYYYRGRGWAAVGTSALLLARLARRSLDTETVAVQSMLGWQVGNGTLFQGVSVIPQRGQVRLRGGLITEVFPGSASGAEAIVVDDPAVTAASILREAISRHLDDFPESILQLTGGLDSRILLAAIPASRRRKVAVVTLRVPGSPDLEIAKQLSRKFGMKHYIGEMPELSDVEPEEVFLNCLGAARNLDCATDPVGFTALKYAERSMPESIRIAGLGGEYARGFYYLGLKELGRPTRSRVARLARWRMFPNESVDAEMFAADFAVRVESMAIDSVYNCFDGSLSWWSSTDEFYLYQRMRRWAGSLATADCMVRGVVNPMLDSRFLEVARSTPARDKLNMQLLSRILLELDPMLGQIPLDGRPAPVKFAGGLSSLVASSGVMSRKVGHKVVQRFRSRRQPPVGAPILAAKVVDYLRSNPDAIEPLEGLAILSREWLGGLSRGTVSPSASSVSLLVNLIAAIRFSGAT